MKTRGFTIVEALIIIVIVAIITTLGFVAYDKFLKPKVASTQTQSTAAPTSVTTIESPSDLDKASGDLDAIDLTDSDDTTTLDTEASAL